MIARKINSAIARLHELGGEMSPEQRAVIRQATAVLTDAANSATHLETATLPLTVPPPTNYLQ